ncbi:crossover junction endodeoxyribonuclease RuvC [Alphaproteobacteria bacterium]|nr:crossover junction endodeoxyribonuclease RuvC [Alphaproteobacteria bacterium]MDA8539207.1 crossover junction endodeoxyribonuclease RuvC [Alphaproteobacteria bacterium]MDA8624117.1 crossover junction endodeoxyribonuclease RuvC [Alphaproteobacteria bacterium]MDA8726357.1 crossover junction endodeoxyribonuclease RuvC [Alphaproteobacteria bacterium]MDA8780386.1 crossover junction endodeoxyribonuclease RuvC [Alphaproteobacteria bacterium]
MSTAKRRLIGLDPGLRFTGWGVVDMLGSKLTHIGNGAVRSDASLSLAERLLQLDEGLAAVVAKYAPDYAAVEQTFVNRDGAATLKLGQARAVCLLVPARRKISVSEYAPNFIKRSVTGSGHADKNQIKTMVQMLLPQAEIENEHAADALAVAITLAHAGDFGGKMQAAIEKADRKRAAL